MKKKILFVFFISIIFISNSSKSSELPTLTKPIYIQEWMYAGPFETGARESAVDALYPWGYDEPKNGYLSAFAEYTAVEWKNVKGTPDGKVSMKINNAPWQVLNESWGIVGVNYITYVKGSVYLDKKYIAKINTKLVRSINLNGRNILADYYNFNRWEPPVILDSGENKIVITLNSYEDSIGFYFAFKPDSNKIRIIENDITVPDAVELTSCDSWIGIPVVNCSDEWIKNNLSVTAGGNEYYLENSSEPKSILPLCVSKIPVRLQSKINFPPVSESKDKNFLELPIKVSIGGTVVNEKTIKIPLKKHSEDRRETFLSVMDSSVQFYGLKEPINFNSSNYYGLVFSLHGAGVNALGQVGAYAPRDWAFVTAPTNRREYGFNWHEEGRLDALEVLGIVQQRYKINPHQIMLTGHSMGGHGAWHFGTLYADKFAAIAPACGWTSIDLYIPTFFTKYNIFASPQLKHIYELGYAPDRPQLYLKNLYNTPIMILVAGADDNVPPVHGRLFTEELIKLGINPELHDLPGRPHWFDEDTIRPGADATDAQFFDDFYKGKYLNTYPDTVKFVMSDPALNNKFYWVKINSTEKYLEPAEIEAINQNDEKFIIKSKNVSSFEIQCKEKKNKGIMIEWNGNILNSTADNNGIINVSSNITLPVLNAVNKNVISGPMKRAYMKPFVMIIGSNTDEKTFNSYLNAARQEALFWWYNSNGTMEIITDKEASEDNIKDKNLILLGTESDNILIAEKIYKTPLNISEEGIEINGKRLAYGDNAVKFIYPDPDEPNRLILFSTGTNSEYALLSESFAAYSVFSALPDYMIFDKKVKEYGYAGVTAAGYFNINWQFDGNLSYY